MAAILFKPQCVENRFQGGFNIEPQISVKWSMEVSPIRRDKNDEGSKPLESGSIISKSLQSVSESN